jgi:hypothetical protein
MTERSTSSQGELMDTSDVQNAEKVRRSWPRVYMVNDNGEWIDMTWWRGRTGASASVDFYVVEACQVAIQFVGEPCNVELVAHVCLPLPMIVDVARLSVSRTAHTCSRLPVGSIPSLTRARSQMDLLGSIGGVSRPLSSAMGAAGSGRCSSAQHRCLRQLVQLAFVLPRDFGARDREYLATDGRRSITRSLRSS